MQAVSSIFQSAPYIGDMPAGRPPSRERTTLGERIVSARLHAGLTQTDLANKVGVTQRVIAYWEREAVSLRPEQVQSLADALDISADDLLGRKASKTRGSGPVGRAKKLFDSISRLPRHQQEKIISILEPFVREHVSANGQH
jgi:transcriptional regulator with XRE-family HTH domain